MTGVDGLNISLDSLRTDRFERITRRKGFSKVMRGLERAIEARFASLKLNCVIMRGFNLDELMDFVNLSIKSPIQVRFIEFMPFASNGWQMSQMVTYKEMLDIILEQHPKLYRIDQKSNDEVCKVYREPNWIGSIGFISSMSDHFCSGCNRLRITADGHFKNCLFGKQELSLRDLMRNGANEEELVKAIQLSLWKKWAKHPGRSLE